MASGPAWRSQLVACVQSFLGRLPKRIRGPSPGLAIGGVLAFSLLARGNGACIVHLERRNAGKYVQTKRCPSIPEAEEQICQKNTHS